jgi:hypothetical protein
MKAGAAIKREANEDNSHQSRLNAQELSFFAGGDVHIVDGFGIPGALVGIEAVCGLGE